MLYATLDLALADIAGRSFNESATVTPTPFGFEVEDDHGTAFAGDVLYWTYSGGMEVDPYQPLDYSRLHEPYESYDEARHIRFNLSTAVEALEAGHPVTFAYAIVDGYPSTPEDIADDEAGQYDGTVGWALLAFGEAA